MLQKQKLTLILLPQKFAICQPSKDFFYKQKKFLSSSFYSLTMTEHEVSLVCEETQVPAGVRVEKGWRCLRIRETLSFSHSGIVASIAYPLAKAHISIFTLSTYNTDYFFFKEKKLKKTLEILRKIFVIEI